MMFRFLAELFRGPCTADLHIGAAEYNSVAISGGIVNNNIFGGYGYACDDYSASATSNSVTVSGNPTFGAGVKISGGGDPSSSTGDFFSGNTLYKNSDVTIPGAANFETVKFGYTGDANITALDLTPNGAVGSLVKLDTGGYDVTFGGVLSGVGGIEKQGASTLTLTGTNDYSGGTTVSAGTLAGDTASLQGNITNHAAVDFHQTSDGAYAGNMDGTGTLTLSGTNTYTGMTTVQSGTLALGSALTSSRDLTLYSGATFQTNGHAHALDHGSLSVRGENASYDGNLSAVGATLNFIAPVTVTRPCSP
jgi:autotransporter-associated beta strand protein